MSPPVPAQPLPTAPPGRVHPNSLAVHKHARGTRSAATVNSPQRSTTNHGNGINNSGEWLRPGIIPTWAAARRSQHDRLSGGELRHPLRQQGKYCALPFGSRAAPFADLGDGATAAGANFCARIERADFNTWRFRRFDHAFPLNAKRLPRYPSRAIGTAAISCRADLRLDGTTGLCPSSRNGPREHLIRGTREQENEGGPLGPPSP